MVAQLGLSEKMETFCRHYVLTHNASEAARIAGYSEATAASQASRMLKRDDIQARIQELVDENPDDDLDVISELEKQYYYASKQGHSNSALKALELIGRAKGNSTEKIDQTPEGMEKEIIRYMEILGEEKMVELLARCNWNYSLPTAEEEKEAEAMVEKQTVKE